MNRFGGFLGAMAQSNVDEGPDVAPPKSDRETAFHLGQRVAEAARRWQHEAGRPHGHCPVKPWRSVTRFLVSVEDASDYSCRSTMRGAIVAALIAGRRVATRAAPPSTAIVPRYVPTSHGPIS